MPNTSLGRGMGLQLGLRRLQSKNSRPTSSQILWRTRPTMGASQETEEALKQYLKENPELKEIAAGSSEAKKKRHVAGFTTL